MHRIKYVLLLTAILVPELQAALRDGSTNSSEKTYLSLRFCFDVKSLQKKIGEISKGKSPVQVLEILNTVDKQDETPLMQVVRSKELLEKLLDYGADPKAKNSDDQDALTIAFKKSYTHPKRIKGIQGDHDESLNILKKKMEVQSEEELFKRALEQGIKFTEDDMWLLRDNIALIKGGVVVDEERDFRLIYDLCRDKFDNTFPDFDNIEPSQRQCDINCVSLCDASALSSLEPDE